MVPLWLVNGSLTVIKYHDYSVHFLFNNICYITSDIVREISAVFLSKICIPAKIVSILFCIVDGFLLLFWWQCNEPRTDDASPADMASSNPTPLGKRGETG